MCGASERMPLSVAAPRVGGVRRTRDARDASCITGGMHARRSPVALCAALSLLATATSLCKGAWQDFLSIPEREGSAREIARVGPESAFPDDGGKPDGGAESGDLDKERGLRGLVLGARGLLEELLVAVVEIVGVSFAKLGKER